MKNFTSLSTAEAVVGIIAILLILAAAVALGGAAVWLIWNFGAPIFWADAPHLSFWKATVVSVFLSMVRAFFTPSVTVESTR